MYKPILFRNTSAPDFNQHFCKGLFFPAISTPTWIFTQKQGDQTGRIFAHWVIVTLSGFLKITEVAENNKLLFHQCSPKFCFYSDKKWVGLHFGRVLHKPIWSPCSETKEMGGGDYFFVVVTVRGIRSYKTIFGRE
jgi:hypothetical protein